jgi:hypothetical protein
MRRRLPAVGVVLAGLLATALAAPGTAASSTAVPSRVLLIVIDGMRPDYIEQFNLPNLKALQASGVSYPNAQVGYMASITVISHNVIASGLLPKHQGWSNEILRDVDNALGGGTGALHVMSSAACDDFRLLVNNGGYPKLEDYLGQLEADQDARMVSIAQKDRSACGVGQPADGNDVIVGIGRLSTAIECDGVSKRWRFPRGVNVPSAMAAPCSRYYVEPTADYGTLTTSPAWLYPLDGHRFVPGFDLARLGGDVWAVDAAIDIMRADATDADDDDWRGLFVGIGGPDKIAHMWGPEDPVTGPPGSVDDMIHLAGELRTADEQVGRLLQELEDQGLDDETLVVVTSDHGMTQAQRFHGVDGAGRGDFNWYYGTETGSRADETYLNPSPAIQALAERIGPNLAFSYQDTHVAVWLNTTTQAARKAAAKAMRRLPDAIATFFLNKGEDRYVLNWTSGRMTFGERAWFNANGARLVNTMAAPYGPDAVALLKDRVTYSVEGDHGGHQRDNQFIPIIIAGPGVEAGTVSSFPITNVDLLPTILDLLGIEPTAPLDGFVAPVPRST